MAFSPIQASKNIQEEYRRYLSTIFSLADDEYQKQFTAALKAAPFAKGPFLEVTDAFETAETIQELIDKGELPYRFKRLGFHTDRPLYRHQVDALRKLAGGRNAVVSTGTGSGKTESFLIPLLKKLVNESESGTLGPGVRAMLIYPMNALANDQIERLREVLSGFPEITFGCYTGQTKAQFKPALADYKTLNEGRAPLQNEYISREQMKKAPPNLLITNYAMLEYLMVRPDDSAFFTPEFTGHWDFIVLDEAHVYRGSTGIEVSMLLRRLKARLNRPGIRYVLTSATLGGDDDNKAVAEFARNLCDSDFSADDVIRAKRKIPARTPERTPPTEFYEIIASRISSDAGDEDILAAVKSLISDISEDSMGEALYKIVRADPFYWKMRELLRKPRTVSSLITETGMNEKQIADFVTVATKAVHESGKLFDARYHMFLRAAESVFLTLAPSKKLFLESKKTYLESGQCYKVFEAAVCNHCHAVYLLGKSDSGILEQESYIADEEPRSAFLLSTNVSDYDDEHTMEDVGEEVEEYELCAICGSLFRKGQKHACNHDQTCFTKLQKVKLKEGKGTLTKCPCCENVSSTGILRQFFTGQEAVTSVIGTSLFESLPSYTVEHLRTAKDESGFGGDEEAAEIKRKVGAKQFIAFSDSRQAAAFYATYLDQTYTNIVYKRLVIETLRKREYATTGKTLDEFVEDLIAQFEKHGMGTGQSTRKEAWKAALHEVLDNNGVTSLYKLGLIGFDINGANMSNGTYKLSKEEIHEICSLFADWIMSEGAVDYPEVMNSDERNFFVPNGVEHNYTLSDADPKSFTLSFLPSRAGFGNKRMDYLEKVLRKKGVDTEAHGADALLEGIWGHLFVKGLMSQQDGKFSLRSDKIFIRRPQQLYICHKCHQITPHNVEGVCPAYKCGGELWTFVPEEAFADNHYYHLYQEMEIRPLRVVEHTAQLDKETAYEYQKQFKKKELDILSCSTTFEMGVDVGSLETVFMRNVPPSPANYAQRAGRAGRSIYSAAFALTFCNRSNHDFTFFREPERMIKGLIAPPVFNTENPKIAIRHVYAAAFSQFWREHPEYFSQTVEFMEEKDGSTGLQMFREYLDEKPESLKAYLNAFLPDTLRRCFRVDDYGWASALTDSQDGLLERASLLYHQDIDALQEAANSAICEKRAGIDALIQRIKVYQSESILAYLARRNIFPQYGFPVDTVEMTIIDRHNSRKTGLQLQRDLAMAISEYAPGSQIVANGSLITSRYIRKMPQKSWKMSRYCKCEICESLNLKVYIPGDDSDPYNTCQTCGAKLDKSQEGVYLVPEFGFEADGDAIKKPGLKKPQRTYKSNVSYIGRDREENETIYNIGSAEIRVGSGNQEEMAVLNRGKFFVCEECGYTELDEKCFSRIMRKKHKRPSGYWCTNNMLHNYSLAYRFETDILSIRFIQPEVTGYEQALSLLYGILAGASKAIGVERDDISGCLKWFYNSECGRANFGFVLYDKTPGGAGHVRRIQDAKMLDCVLRETLNLIKSCTCGGEAMDTSCYSCLRNYYNQKYHELLQRRYVVEFLEKALDE